MDATEIAAQREALATEYNTLLEFLEWLVTARGRWDERLYRLTDCWTDSRRGHEVLVDGIENVIQRYQVDRGDFV